jgi:hypothetical protein
VIRAVAKPSSAMVDAVACDRRPPVSQAHRLRFLNCPEFSGRFSKISQAHNPISGIQFHASGGGALRAVASRRGLSQEPPRRATAEAEWTYAAWVFFCR